MVAAGGNVEDRVEVGRLAGRGQHAGGAALHRRDFGGDIVVGGVLEAGVEVAGGLEVKELAHLLAGGVGEGGRLDDRDLAGLARLRGITGMEGRGFNFHYNYSLSLGRFQMHPMVSAFYYTFNCPVRQAGKRDWV